MQNFLYYMREMLVLKCVYLGSYIVGGVGGQYLTLCLEKCGSFVVVLVNQVDG